MSEQSSCSASLCWAWSCFRFSRANASASLVSSAVCLAVSTCFASSLSSALRLSILLISWFVFMCLCFWCEWFKLPVLESFALPLCVVFAVGVCECDFGSGVFVLERWFVGSFALCCVEVVDGDFAAEDS